MSPLNSTTKTNTSSRNFVSVFLYTNNYDKANKLDDATLQTFLFSVCAFWLLSALAFVSVMERQFFRTFYSTNTASEYRRKLVLSLREDQDDLKSKVLLDHPDVYKSWGPSLLKPWTLKNWEKWEKEKPGWFSDRWTEGVPNDYIPYDWCVKYKKTKGRVDDADLKKRRGSISGKELLGGKEDL